jgi:hypothetical protein
MDEATERYLATAQPRLERAGFTCTRDPSAAGGSFAMVARRKRWELTKMGQADTWMMFAPFPAINPEWIRSFSEQCFRYVADPSGGLPRGLGRAVFVYPVAITQDVDPATSQVIRTQAPRKHWGGNEMPVIVELATAKLHYFEKTPLWGAAYYRGFRKMIKELLAP